MAWIDVSQQSDEWLNMRKACVTASNMSKVMAKLKRVKKAREGESSEPVKMAAERRNYLKQKVYEQLTGRSADSYVSPYMERGIANEEIAVGAYQAEYQVEVLNGGLYIHDLIPRFLASPDGRVGEDGLVEAKYLTGFTTEANHADLLQGAEIAEEYMFQMQAQLACSGRMWCDFVSYDGDMPKGLKLFVKRIPRNPAMISAIELETVQFLSELATILQQLGKKACVHKESRHITDDIWQCEDCGVQFREAVHAGE